MICYILDDQYGESIYNGLKKSIKSKFPVTKNIMNPFDYLGEIENQDVDLILLDNYFPNRWSGREEPIWSEFLNTLLKKGIKTKVLCISDYWDTLVHKYDAREAWVRTWLVVWFVPTKQASDIQKEIVNLWFSTPSPSSTF